MRAACLLALCSLLGCERAAPTPSNDVVSVQVPEPDAARAPVILDAASDAGARAAEPLRAKPPRMTAHIDAVHGGVLSERGELHTGDEIVKPVTVELEAGARLTLSFRDFVKVEAMGPAMVRVLPHGEAALLVHDGVVSFDVAPRGVRQLESAFWVATPTLQLDVADGARAALRAHPNSATELEVVSGFLTVAQATGGLPVRAGATLCATLPKAEVRAGAAATLERAVARLQHAKSCAPRARTTDEAVAEAHAKAERLVADARRIEQEHLAEHARQLASDAGAAQALRGQLAQLGQQLAHLGGAARALAAQRDARRLMMQPSGTSPANELGLWDPIVRSPGVAVP